MFNRLCLASASIAICALAAGSVPAEGNDLRSMDRPAIVLVSGGCGLAFHRTPFGACVPNCAVYFGAPPVVRLPPPCPRFYHRDPDPARPICYPNL